MCVWEREREWREGREGRSKRELMSAEVGPLRKEEGGRREGGDTGNESGWEAEEEK